VLFAAAFLSGQRILAGARVTTPVWTAARDLPAYAELTPEDLVAVGVRLPTALVQRYAGASLDLSGAVLTRPVRRGELIALGWLSRGAPAEAGRTVSIPLAPEQGLGTELRPGDRLDVMVTLDAGDVRARTLVLASGVEVVEVVRASGLVAGGSTVTGVTVAVSPEEAVEIAFGVRSGDIDIARVDGSEGPTPPGAVTAEDLP